MPDPPTEELWIREKSVESVELAFKVQNILFSGRSQYQQVEVIQTVDHGRMLVLDGSVMFTERDEFIYHEMIAHVPLFVHPEPKNVLVVGGGDGGTVREILKHRSVERVVMVEIDPMVVEACRKHIPSVSSALDDPRLELCIEDAVRYVAASKDTFDIAIVDSTDPVGPGVELFGRDFYRNAARLLGTEGLLVTQAESSFYDRDTQVQMLMHQRPFFKRLHLYLYSTLSYPGGLYAFGFASCGPHPLQDLDPSRRPGMEGSLQYYTPAIHRAAFALPVFLESALEGFLDPLK